MGVIPRPYVKRLLTRPMKGEQIVRASFKGVPITLQNFQGKTFSMLGFELSGVLWLLLDGVMETLHLTPEDLEELRREEPEDFTKLDDGREVIKEGGFYYFALFVSDRPEAQELKDWVFGSVMPSIFEKGYYSIEEELKK